MAVLDYISLLFTSKELNTEQKWVLGLINLTSVVIFWVLSSFLVNDLFETDIYRKPFFITYVNTSCFAFYLLPYLYHENISFNEFVKRVKDSYRDHRRAKRFSVSYIRLQNNSVNAYDSDATIGGYGSSDNLSALESQQLPPSIINQLGSSINSRAAFEGLGSDTPSGVSTPVDSSPPTGTANTAPGPATATVIAAATAPATATASALAPHPSTDYDIPLYETISLSFQFSILWFSANLVTNASLSYTSVASQTILSSSSSFFTLIIGYLCSVGKINTNKVVGLILSFIGVIIVTEIDSSDPPSSSDSPMITLWGNLLALSGAFFYGIYTILLKFKVMIKNSNKERNLNTHLFFAFVGIFSLVMLWPLLIILNFTGHEKFELPKTNYVLGLLLLNAVITFVSDLCWCKAVLLTSPLTVTVGLSMTIPLAMVGDWLVKGFSINFLYLLGAIIVTVGFLIINKDEEDDFVVHRDD